jgi:hypothetical protein
MLSLIGIKSNIVVMIVVKSIVVVVILGGGFLLALIMQPSCEPCATGDACPPCYLLEQGISILSAILVCSYLIFHWSRLAKAGKAD